MEHQIEIKIIIRRCHAFFERNIPIQAEPFEMTLSFKNKGENALEGATISGIKWYSASEQKISETLDETFPLGILKPKEERKIMIEKTGTYAHGLFGVNLNIRANDGKGIKTFQVNPFTKRVTPIQQLNWWTDSFFIRSQNEYSQGLANLLIILLTIVLIGVSGLTYFLVQQQTSDADIQTIPARISQAQALQNGIKFCKNNPSSENSGLYNLTDGTQASCQTVLQEYAK